MRLLTAGLQVQVLPGEPLYFHVLIVVLLLAESPESESSRGFFVGGLGQRVSSSSRSPRVISGSRESRWGAVGKVGVSTAVRRDGRKLSDSPVNTTLAVNAVVSIGARTPCRIRCQARSCCSSYRKFLGVLWQSCMKTFRQRGHVLSVSFFDGPVDCE